MSLQSPLLSYKKPRKDRTPSLPSTPRMSTANSPSASVSSSTANLVEGGEQSGKLSPKAAATSSKRVSSRRKALQEYYHLQQSKQKEGKDEGKAQEQGNEHGHEHGQTSESHGAAGSTQSETKGEANHLRNSSSLKSEEDVEKFIESASMNEILQLRNSLSAKLNASNQRRKEIMYDNYHELIKLSKTLGKFSQSQISVPVDPAVEGLNGLRIFKPDAVKPSSTVDFNSYLDKCIEELKQFNELSVKKMTGDFDSVLERISS
ncbi:uncharacterized protein LODBEIA_P03850 [Lodderomyces beijingensis]|uniref:Vacuolar protein sorting-associated protein 51 homolog n=1 Tax=Lodderomyces beijingensis TaxID=1775926 RepID=A0ABP0ZDB5_9ASCO